MKYWRKTLDQHKIKPIRGQVDILKERCKGCRFCIEFCPRQVLEEAEGFNSKGYHPVDVAHPHQCVNCGLCQLICPEFAIRVLPIQEGQAGEVGCHA